MALFKKGYEAAREEKKRQEEAREQMGKRLFRFFLSGDVQKQGYVFLQKNLLTSMNTLLRLIEVVRNVMTVFSVVGTIVVHIVKTVINPHLRELS